jgi:hypothetical protein
VTRITIPDLRRALDRRQLREADINDALYVAPLGARGEHVVEYPIGSGNQVKVGSALQGQTFKPGSSVPVGSHTGDARRGILGGPPAGRRGVSGFPADATPPGQLEAIGILSATPPTVESGASVEPTTLTGYGFTTSTTFEAVRQTATGWEVDPLVTVATVSIPDAETANITLTVDAATPAGYTISFRIVDRSAVGPNLVRVIEAALACPTASITGKSYLGAYFDSGSLYAYDYNDHEYVSEIAAKAHSYSSTVAWGGRAESSGTEYLFGKGKSGGTVRVFSWNLSTNTLYETDTGFAGTASQLIGPVASGSTLYYGVTSAGGNTITLHSVALGSTTPSSVGSLSDAAIDWSAQPRALAPAGTTILVQGFEAGAAAGSRGVWSSPSTSTLRVASFHEDRRWERDGRRSGTVAAGWGLWADDDELQTLTSSGVLTTLAGVDTWAALDADFDVSPDGSEVVFFPQESGGDFGTLFRVEVQDWTSLTGCTIVGTETVEDIPAHFSSPDAMFARD